MIPDDDIEIPAAPAAERAAPFPWPPSPGTSSIEALVATIAEVLMRPARTFAALSPSAPLAPAALFLIVLTYAGAGVQLFWRMVLPVPEWVPAAMVGSEAEAVADFLVSGPFALAVTTLVALVVHAGLVVFGARRERPGATVAVLYYASASGILQIVPWIGALLAGVLGLVVSVVGVREVHGTSTGRAAAAVLVPLFAVGALFAFGVLLLLLAGFSTGLLSR